MKLKRSLAIIIVCAAFVLGLVARHWWSGAVLASGVITLLVATSLCLRTRQFIVLGLLMLSAGCGWWRADNHEVALARIQTLYGQKVVVEGTIADDPTVNDKGYLLFSMTNPQLNGQPLHGSVLVRTYFQKLKRGYRIQATSKFDSTLGNKVGQLVFATVQIQDTRLSLLEQWRQRYFAGMRTALPEPQAGFALGLLLGTRGLMSKELQDLLTTVGLTHLVAVSGYNLTIIIDAAKKPLRRVSKFMSVAVPLWLVAGFVVLTGLSASIVRAAIVSLLSLAAYYYGRTFKPMVLIALAVVATLLYNPAYVWSDVGWQLSFLAFFGILVVAPLVQSRLKLQRPLAILLTESLAAYVLTLPLIMAVFGRASLVAPLANVLILPLVPLTMLASLIAGLLGIGAPLLAPVLALPLRFMIDLSFAIMQALAGLPLASSQLQLSPFAALLIYACLAAALAMAYFRQNLTKWYADLVE